MTSFFKSNKFIALIDKQTGEMQVKDKINVILTPSYYWIKRAQLDVKFTSMALKYAPSVFEGMLPKGNYDYYAVKTKKEYLFFAYDPDEIISSLGDKGIQESQISGIYFAQNELEGISTAVECNSEDALVVHKRTVLQVRKYLVDSSSLSSDLDQIKELSKHKITLHKSSVTHSLKELAPLMYVLGLLIVLYSAQLFFTYAQQQKVRSQPSVFSEYGLPATFVQNSSIEKKLRKSFKEQKSFRKLVFAILKLPLSQRQRMQVLNYEKEIFKITFEMDDYARLRDVQLHLQESLGTLVSIEIDKNIMRVKIK